MTGAIPGISRFLAQSRSCCLGSFHFANDRLCRVCPRPIDARGRSFYGDAEDVIVVISLAIEVICAAEIVQILLYFAGHALPTAGSGASLISIMTPVAAEGQASELAVFLRHTLTLLIIGGQR